MSRCSYARGVDRHRLGVHCWGSAMISGFKGMHPFGVTKKAVKEFMDDDMATHAAALTYRILVALFPFLIFILTLFGALRMDDLFDSLLQEARRAFAPDVYNQLETIVAQVESGASGGLLSFGLLLAIWSASGGVRAVMHALNVAYDVEQARPLWKKFLFSVLFTIGLAIILLSAAVLMFMGPQSVGWLADQVGLGSLFVTVWTWARIPVAIVLMILAIALIYYFFPNVEQPFAPVTPGSMIAVIVWLLATLGFSVYLANFGNFNATYGSLAGVIILLLYFYLSSAILLFGAEVNAVIYKAHPETDKSNVEMDAVVDAKQEAREEPEA